MISIFWPYLLRVDNDPSNAMQSAKLRQENSSPFWKVSDTFILLLTKSGGAKKTNSRKDYNATGSTKGE